VNFAPLKSAVNVGCNLMKYSPSKYEHSSLYMLYFEMTNISSSLCQ